MADLRAKPLILASASRARRTMLQRAGIDFSWQSSTVDETLLKSELSGRRPRLQPEAVAIELARAKAEAVSRACQAALVIGADQVLAVDGATLSKPDDLEAARRSLQALRGRRHQLHSAVVVAEAGGASWHAVETATLVMRDFSNAFLEAYLQDTGPSICESVGAYKLEATGIQLFERIEGDYFTILGMPLLPLLTELRRRGVIEV